MDLYLSCDITYIFLENLQSDELLRPYFINMAPNDIHYVHMMQHVIQMFMQFNMDDISNHLKLHIQAAHYKLNIDNTVFTQWINVLEKTFNESGIDAQYLARIIRNIQKYECFILKEIIHDDVTKCIKQLNNIINQ